MNKLWAEKVGGRFERRSLNPLVIASPISFDMVVARSSDICLKKNNRTMSCNVTADREFNPDDMVLERQKNDV